MGVLEAVGVGVADVLGVLVGVGVKVGIAVAVDVGVEVGVWVAVAVGVVLTAAVAVGVAVDVAVLVAVAVGVGGGGVGVDPTVADTSLEGRLSIRTVLYAVTIKKTVLPFAKFETVAAVVFPTSICCV